MIVNANARISIALKTVIDSDTNELKLETLILPIAFRDLIEIEVMENSPSNIVHYANRSSHISEKKIMDIALLKMQEHYGYKQKFHVVIHKNVPTGYGLGSGASDAAAIMNAIVKMLKLKTTKEELLTVAKAVGRDVPYFFTNKIAIYDINTHNTKVVTKKFKAFVLLLLAPKPVDRARIVNEYSPNEEMTHHDFDHLVAAFQKPNIKAVGQALFNELENEVLKVQPELAKVLDDLRKEKIEAFGISGASSTIFALSETKHLLERFALKYSKIGYRSIVTNIIN